MRYAIIAAALALTPAAALAQEGTAAGVIGGAATGAVVGGPVGAAAGAVVGGIAGTIVAPPREVRTYVVKQPVDEVRIQERVVVGEALPDTVVIRTVPKYEKYSYAYVNGERVIVDAQTRRVIEVVN